MKPRKRGLYRGKICLTQEQIEQVRREISFQARMTRCTLQGLRPIIMIDHKPNDEMSLYDAMALGLIPMEFPQLPALTMEQVKGWQRFKLMRDELRFPMPLRAVKSRALVHFNCRCVVQTYTLNGRIPACPIDGPSSGLPLQPCGL